MATLIIENVDFDRLENQRSELIILEKTLPDSYGLVALQGVIAMLDEWSDKVYYERAENANDE